MRNSDVAEVTLLVVDCNAASVIERRHTTDLGVRARPIDCIRLHNFERYVLARR